MVNLNRVANDKQQFVLPAIPANIATSLAQAIARYKVGFSTIRRRATWIGCGTACCDLAAAL